MGSLDYLLDAAEPWVVYRASLDLLHLDSADTRVVAARRRMLESPLVRELVDLVPLWPGKVLNSHKSAGQAYHRLAFLAELGLTAADVDAAPMVRTMMEHRSDKGLFQLPMIVSPSHGGTGREQWAWALCDAPLTLYAVALMGLVDQADIDEGLGFLVSLGRDNGWPCAVSRELGSFRGPGRKSDPCPYATLIMLKLLALFPGLRQSPAARAGVECLLDLWQNSRERHPYMFFMGTDFRKLKAPFVWYDILHVVEVLSRFDWAMEDSRFVDMLEVVNSKADECGRFTAESEWKAWKGWDFAQKKQPSPWITFLVRRVNHRVAQRRAAR